MEKSLKNNEVAIEILTDEIIEALSDDVKADVVLLTDKLGSKMTKMNPLVREFNELVKYNEYLPSQDKDFDVDDKLYKEIWKDVRSFRSGVKSAKTEMKADILKTGKALDNVEKTFVEKATEIQDAADIRFSWYLSEKKRKKDEAQQKKDEAANAEMQRIKDEAEEIKQRAFKAEAYNKVKYDYLKGMEEQYAQNAPKFSPDTILANIENLDKMKFEDNKTYTEHFKALTDEQHMELNAAFKEAVVRIKANLEKVRKDSIKKILEDQMQSGEVTAPEPPKAPTPQGHGTISSGGNVSLNYRLSEVKELALHYEQLRDIEYKADRKMRLSEINLELLSAVNMIKELINL